MSATYRFNGSSSDEVVVTLYQASLDSDEFSITAKSNSVSVVRLSNCYRSVGSYNVRNKSADVSLTPHYAQHCASLSVTSGIITPKARLYNANVQ